MIKKININELKYIVTESVKRVLKEGMTSDNPMFDKWFEAKEILGADRMLDVIWNYLDASQIESIIEGLDQDYQLWDEEDDTEDWAGEENENYPDDWPNEEDITY